MSRDAVLAAAKQRFAAEGYEKTTLRAIARDAHVDPSLIVHYFGSKQGLLEECLRLPVDPRDPLPALRAASAKPQPSSLTRRQSMSPSSCSCTLTVCARAWRITLVNDS